MIAARWRWFVRHAVRRSVANDDLEAEIRAHLAFETERLTAAGASPAAARRQASREFGNVLLIKDITRDMWGWGVFERICRDLGYGLRMLRRRPIFTVVAIASLAIGIGANTAIFSVVNAIMLRDLPYERPEELVDIHIQVADTLFPTLSYPNFEDIRDSTAEVFTGVALSQFTSAQVEAELGAVVGEAVTGDYFPVLGLEPVLGRTIGPADDQTRGGHPVVMLSHGYWQTRYGGDPAVIGRELELDGRPYTVIGVAPANYPGILRGFIRPSFYVPMMMVDEVSGTRDLRRLETRDSANMFAKARLRSGVSLPHAETAVAGVATALSAARPPGWDPSSTFRLARTADVLLFPQADGAVRALGSLLMVVVGLVLLLACTNLAGFLLARALDQQREVAMRLALGASRGALIRQRLTETTLLGLLGGAIGFGLAVWLLRVMPDLDLGSLTLTVDATPDSTVLVFTLGVSLLAGTVLGLVPALRSTKPMLAGTLRGDTAGAGHGGRQRWRRALVVTQLTVSLVLLVVAGLFVRSLFGQQAADPGFGGNPAAVMTVTASADRFGQDDGRRYTEGLLERFRQLPGVEAVGRISKLPLSFGTQRMNFTIDGHEPPGDETVFRAERVIVDGHFFEAASIPLRAGRTFTDADRHDGPSVVIVSEAMARRFWPDGTAVGQLVRVTGGSPMLPGLDDGRGDLRVVGVAADIDWATLGETPRLLAYVPYSQHYVGRLNVIARTSTDADQTARALLTTGRALDPDLAAVSPTTLAEHLGTLLRPLQVLASLLSTLALLALLLAAIGLYGVTSYAVASRTREVGIRIALGADILAVRRLLTASGLWLTAAGCGIGMALALAVARLLASRLFGIEAFDVVTFLGAVLVLLVTAALAAYLPARRVSRVDPILALRAE